MARLVINANFSAATLLNNRLAPATNSFGAVVKVNKAPINTNNIILLL